MTRAGPVAWIFAGICWLIAFAGLAALPVLVLMLGLGLWSEPAEPAPIEAWLVNISWLGTFALQHSGMARRAFKTYWTRFVPDYLERSAYAAASGAVVACLCVWWQPLGGDPWWDLPLATEAGALLGAAGMTVIANRIDGLGLLGIRQVLEHGQHQAPDRLQIVGPYRWVRHPLMSCLLIFLWCHPVMPPTLALLSGGLTVYVALALILEERDLIARFGSAYVGYRQRVPALVPWRGPVPASVHAEVTE
jgi:protein-S-isoprenylcysteine O-methyltransferase Ste14